MRALQNAMFYLITIICITCALGEVFENFTSSDEVDYDFINVTECDCGLNAFSCRFDTNGQKYCECDNNYIDFNGTCVECKCGNNAISCELDHHEDKRCTCKDDYVFTQGECFECDCGQNAVLCFYDWKNNKTCLCRNGYVARNGKCIKSCLLDKECQNGRVCQPNEEGEYFCDCPRHFGGEDCKTNLCEELEPMCRDMGAECLVENSKAFCRCPWGQVVGLPSGICEECNCGNNARSCELDHHGDKRCTCKDGYVFTQGECTECDCGQNAAVCFYDWRNNKTCVCRNGYVARNGTCIKSCLLDKECQNGQVCQPNEEGEYFCDCPRHFGGEDCKTNLLCEELEPMCRDMGAECLVENSKAFCRCPWGQIVGLPSGICEDLCNPETCFHGRCEFLTNSKVERNYRCICDKGYTGLRCETKIPEESVSGELIRFVILVSINAALFILMSAMFCFMCRRSRNQMV